MTSRQPRSLLGRLIGLLRGAFAGWVRDREHDNPRAVYQHAIEERTRHYADLKRAVAGILYMRNKLEGEITELRGAIARLLEDIHRAVRKGDDEAALALVARKQSLVEELERAEHELDKVRAEADEAKENLGRFRQEIRTLEREKIRALATLANARARRRIHAALEGFSFEGELRALESVREYVAQVQAEGRLTHEAESDGLAARLEAIRAESRVEAARQELAALKRHLEPQALPAETASREALVAPGLARVVGS